MEVGIRYDTLAYSQISLEMSRLRERPIACTKNYLVSTVASAEKFRTG